MKHRTIVRVKSGRHHEETKEISGRNQELSARHQGGTREELRGYQGCIRETTGDISEKPGRPGEHKLETSGK